METAKPLGLCPRCGKNLALVGHAHLCREAPEEHVPSTYGPGGEIPIDYVAYQSREIVCSGPTDVTTGKRPKREPRKRKPDTAQLQKAADEIKKRGRPRTKTPEERKAYRAEWARKKRGAK
jgi:hypothetical protein